MKNKVFGLVIILLTLFTGVVSAANLWGTYKGNQIIRLTVDGKPVKVTDVPAILYNNRTMIPIYLLQQVGIKYNWDGKNQTVNIHSNASSTSFDPTKTAETIMNLGGGGVTITKIGNETTAITYYQAKTNFDNDWKYITRIFAELIKYNAVYSRVVYHDGNIDIGYVEGKTQDFKDFINGKITESELNKRIVFYNYPQSPGGSVLPGANGQSEVIKSKIDGTFDGFNYENIYVLENGQVWKQTSFDISVAYKYHPEVLIYKDGMHYYMIVEGSDKKVKVELVK